MTDTPAIGENEDRMMNAASAVNAPPSVVVMSAMMPTFLRSLLALPAKVVNEIAGRFEVKKERKKADTISGLVNRLEALMFEVPTFPLEISQSMAERWMASGAFGPRVGMITKLNRVFGGVNEAWDNATDYVKKALPSARKSRQMIDDLVVSYPTDYRIEPTGKWAVKNGSAAVGELMSQDWTRATQKPTPQLHHDEWRLRCKDSTCCTSGGIASFVAGIGHGAKVANNPAIETQRRYFDRSRTVSVVPPTLFNSKGDVIIENTTFVANNRNCPTCKGSVDWTTRPCGGSSHTNHIGGFSATVKLPAIVWSDGTGTAPSPNEPSLYRTVGYGAPVRIELNENTPRHSTTFAAVDGYPAFGKYGSGKKQRRGVAADPDADPKKRVSAQLTGDVQIMRVVIRMNDGIRVSALAWVFIHDEYAQNDGINSPSLNEAAHMVQLLTQAMSRSTDKKAKEGAVLLGALDRLHRPRY